MSNLLPLYPSTPDIPYDLRAHMSLSDIENLKLCLIKEVINIFHDYPGIGAINFMYEKSAKRLWDVAPRFVLWDTVENILSSESYKSSKVNLGAFVHNSWTKKDKNQKCIYSTKDGEDLISLVVLEEVVKSRFSCLLRKACVKDILIEDYNRTRLEQGQRPTWFLSFRQRDAYGNKNLFLKKEIESFFGQNMLKALEHIRLQELLEHKSKSVKKNYKKI